MIDARSYAECSQPFDDIDGRSIRVTGGPWRGHAGHVAYQCALTPRGVRVRVALDHAPEGVDLWLSDVDFTDAAPLAISDALFDTVPPRPRFEPLALQWGVFDHERGELVTLQDGQQQTGSFTVADDEARRRNGGAP